MPRSRPQTPRNFDRDWYDRKYELHRPMWDWVEAFVKRRRITSMLEIGGGYGRNSAMVERYLNIELNKKCVTYATADIVIADWCTMDVTPYRGRFDVVVAGAVVEHCPGYEAFIDQIIAVESRFGIVSFYRGIKPGVTDKIRDRHSNRYGERSLIPFLESRRLDYELLQLPRTMGSKADGLLVITSNGQ